MVIRNWKKKTSVCNSSSIEGNIKDTVHPPRNSETIQGLDPTIITSSKTVEDVKPVKEIIPTFSVTLDNKETIIASPVEPEESKPVPEEKSEFLKKLLENPDEPIPPLEEGEDIFQFIKKVNIVAPKNEIIFNSSTKFTLLNEKEKEEMGKEIFSEEPNDTDNSVLIDNIKSNSQETRRRPSRLFSPEDIRNGNIDINDMAKPDIRGSIVGRKIEDVFIMGIMYPPHIKNFIFTQQCLDFFLKMEIDIEDMVKSFLLPECIVLLLSGAGFIPVEDSKRDSTAKAYNEVLNDIIKKNKENKKVGEISKRPSVETTPPPVPPKSNSKWVDKRWEYQHSIMLKSKSRYANDLITTSCFKANKYIIDRYNDLKPETIDKLNIYFEQWLSKIGCEYVLTEGDLGLPENVLNNADMIFDFMENVGLDEDPRAIPRLTYIGKNTGRRNEFFKYVKQ